MAKRGETWPNYLDGHGWPWPSAVKYGQTDGHGNGQDGQMDGHSHDEDGQTERWPWPKW